MKVKVEQGSYHDRPTLNIYEDRNGEISEKPVISFGFKKAKAIVAAMDDIEQFVIDNDYNNKPRGN